MSVAETVQTVAREERSIHIDIELIENPRSGETMVEEFAVDISAARDRLGWKLNERVEQTVRKAIVEDN